MATQASAAEFLNRKRGHGIVAGDFAGPSTLSETKGIPVHVALREFCRACLLRARGGSLPERNLEIGMPPFGGNAGRYGK